MEYFFFSFSDRAMRTVVVVGLPPERGVVRSVREAMAVFGRVELFHPSTLKEFVKVVSINFLPTGWRGSQF